MTSYGTQLVEKLNTMLVFYGIPVPERQPTMQQDILVRMDLLIEGVGGGGSGGGGGIPEAPEDGKLYGRQNIAWAEIPAAMQEMSVVSMPGQMDYVLNPELNTVYDFPYMFYTLDIQSIPMSLTQPIVMFFYTSNPTTISFPANTKFLGSIPIFDNFARYELSIINGVVSISKIVS